MCDPDKQPINEKGLHDAIINVEETHHQDPILSVKYSSPILLQFEWLLHLQSHHSLQYNTHQQHHQYPTLSEHSLSSGEHLQPNNIISHQKSEVCSVETHTEGQFPQEMHSFPTFLLFSWHLSLQFHSLSFIHSTLMT